MRTCGLADLSSSEKCYAKVYHEISDIFSFVMSREKIRMLFLLY